MHHDWTIFQQQLHQQHASLKRVYICRRRQFSSKLEGSVLDYLHYSPQALEDCVKTMHTLFSNILEHPDDPKYRKVGPASSSCTVNAFFCEASSRRYPACAATHVHTVCAQIRAVNKSYLRHIAGVNHAEDLMLQAGWRSKVCLHLWRLSASCMHTCACLLCCHALASSCLMILM